MYNLKARDENLWRFSNQNVRKNSTGRIRKEHNTRVREETKSHGSVGLKTYKSFFKAVQSPCFVIFVLTSTIAYQFVQSGLDYYMSVW